MEEYELKMGAKQGEEIGVLRVIGKTRKKVLKNFRLREKKPEKQRSLSSAGARI